MPNGNRLDAWLISIDPMPMHTQQQNFAMATIVFSYLVLEGTEGGGGLASLSRGKGSGRAEDGSEAGGGLHGCEKLDTNEFC